MSVKDLTRRRVELGQRPALILVDMMNGFTDPSSPLGSRADAVVAACEHLLQRFRALNLPVVFTTVVFHEAGQARVFRARLPALEILQPDSHWVQIDPRLRPLGREIIVEKQGASAFFGTDLDAHLTNAQADSLVVTGLTTSGCVRATVVDGLQHDYPVVVPREAVGDRNEAAHEGNLKDLHAKYADVESLEKVLGSLEAL